MAADSMRVARVRSVLYSAMSAQPPLPSKGQPLQGRVYYPPLIPPRGKKRKSYVRLRYSRQARAPTHRHRDFRRVIGAQGLRCLYASNPAAPTHSTSQTGRPDSHARRLVASYLYSKLCASGGKTVVPRSNLIPSAACRGYRLATYVICVRLPPRLKPKRHPAPNNIGQSH